MSPGQRRPTHPPTHTHTHTHTHQGKDELFGGRLTPPPPPSLGLPLRHGLLQRMASIRGLVIIPAPTTVIELCRSAVHGPGEQPPLPEGDAEYPSRRQDDLLRRCWHILCLGGQSVSTGTLRTVAGLGHAVPVARGTGPRSACGTWDWATQCPRHVRLGNTVPVARATGQCSTRSTCGQRSVLRVLCDRLCAC